MYTSGEFWLPLGALYMSYIGGIILTFLSFIYHKNAHSTVAAVLAAVGYVSKLPVYILSAIFIFSLERSVENIMLCLTLAVIIVAATGYAVHMIMFWVKTFRFKDHSQSEEQRNDIVR